ncbi:MAG: peptidase S8 [Planctomycetes bacterium]|nr:peptidase S8 [Planctomycetota bacterium]
MKILASLLIVLVAVALPVTAQSETAVRVMTTDQGSQRIIVDTAHGDQTLHHTQYAVLNARVHPVAGSSAVGLTWTELRPGRPVQFQTVSVDGQKFIEPRETTYDLQLKYGGFDPLFAQPQIPAHLDANQGGRQWIVQYWTQGLEQYRDELRRLGAVIHLHLPNHANVVEMDPSLVSTVATLPFVRAVVSFHPAYKLETSLLTEQLQGFSGSATRRINIMAFRRGLVGQNPIAARVRALGGSVHKLDPYIFTMVATVNIGIIADLARMDEVQWMDPYGDPEDDMNIARQFHGADYIETQAGFDGTGVRAEVLDSGCLTTHQEFQSPPLIPHGALVSASHGTSTTGQVFATGVDPTARGMLPAGQGVAAFYNGLAGGSRYNHSAELVNPGLGYRCVFQTNSWGGPRTTSYNSSSQEMDLILFDLESLVITQSQSNAGNQMSRPQAWAKNCVGVGAADHVNTLTPNDDNISGASIGPAQDGRVKPELASFYDNIRTTSNSSTTSYTNSFGGTSGATPIVAGSFGLFYQMWHNGIFGNPTATTVFQSRPKNTTARAFMIAGARQWNWPGVPANSGLDRDKQGWGHPDLQRLYDYRSRIYYVDETDFLTNLQSTSHAVTVPAGETLFKACLTWRDNPGTVSATQHLINNLDLRVTSPSGQVYLGNVGLTNNASGSAGEALFSSTGGSADTKNSVENVFVQNPQAGTWVVEVIATSLNQDIHPETSALDADYALCILGVLPGTVSFFDLSLTSNAGGDLTMDIDNVPAGTTQGFTVFSEMAAGPVGGGVLFGLNPTLISLFSFQVPVGVGNVFHWSYPSGGAYPDAPVTFPGLPASLYPIDAVGLAIDGAFNISVTPNRRAL